MNILFARRAATIVAVLSVCSFALASWFPIYAAEPAKKQGPERWQAEIERMTAKDAEKPPAKGGTLFLGSSSIRLWDLEKSFPGQNYLNRGFGGSEISDSLHYLDELVFAYEPKTIVFYAGDNDLANKKSPERVAADFRELSERVAERLPETRILYIAVKPSLQRWSLIEKVRAANDAIAKYCVQTPNCTFIDIASPMLGEDGLPRKELFVADGLHMSPAGYEIWTKLVAAELEADKAKE